MIALSKNLYFLIPILAVLSSPQHDDQMTKEDQIVSSVIKETAEAIEKKHNISPCGIGMSGHFKYLEISFDVNRIVGREEARMVLIDCLEIFLSNINSCEKLRPYLKNHPFGHENAGIKLFFTTPSGREVFHPNICVAATNKRGLYFRTDDPENEFRYKETYQETHAEAIAKVKAKHPEFKFGSWEKIRISDRSSKIE